MVYRTFEAFEVCVCDHCTLSLRNCNSVPCTPTTIFPPQASQSSIPCQTPRHDNNSQIPCLIFSILQKHHSFDLRLLFTAATFGKKMSNVFFVCLCRASNLRCNLFSVLNDALLLSFSFKTPRKHLYPNKDRTKQNCLVLQATLQELNQ